MERAMRLRRCVHGWRVCWKPKAVLAMSVVKMAMEGGRLRLATQLRVSVGLEDSQLAMMKIRNC